MLSAVLTLLLATSFARAQECGGAVNVGTAGNVTISSPNYPAFYPANSLCRWNVIGPIGKAIQITTESFSVELSTDCKWDYLEIDGVKFCGAMRPAVMFTDSPLVIRFVSDACVQYQGFKLILEAAVNPSGGVGLTLIAPLVHRAASTERTNILFSFVPRTQEDCGGSVTVGSSGNVTITSPKYPAFYPNKAKCTWDIIAPANKALKLTVVEFALESSSICSFDYLEVDDVKFCGTDGPGELIADSPLRIRFVSDASIQHQGFRATLEAVPQISSECGGNIDVQEGEVRSFVSPRFPGFYPKNASCTWQITGPPEKGLTFSSGTFQLDKETSKCANDAVEFLTSLGSLGKFCGKTGPSKFKITANKVTVKFESSISGKQQGFNITVGVDNCPNSRKCPNDPSQCIRLDQFCDDNFDERSCNGECGIPTTPPNLALTAVAGRIVGGAEAEPHSWPWQVAFLLNGGESLSCGGTLIHENFVMTAAHCCEGRTASKIHIRVGAHDLRKSDSEANSKLHKVRRIISHPLYALSSSMSHDFCLLELDEAVTFSPDVTPACLSAEADIYVGKRCYATGWGSTAPARLSSGIGLDMPERIPSRLARSQANVLQQTDVEIEDQAKCQRAYGSTSIETNMICASSPGHDSCQGDSGGPLVCQSADGQRFVLAGVTSFGRGCARPGYPGVYALITTVTSWVNEVILNLD